MSFILINQTPNSTSYVNGRISLPASGQVSVSQGLIPYLALDANFLSDIMSSPPNTIISDSVSNYSGTNAYQYIQTWLANGPPQNSNDPVAFTLAGMGFSVTASATLNSATEVPLLLLTNPNNSTVNARAMFFFAAPAAAQGIVTVKGYTNPTITNNGNSLPIQNNLVEANPPVSAMNAYALPTVSNNGALRIGLVSNANASTDLINFAQTAILTPGNSLLITVSVNNLGLLSSALTYFYMQWVEA